MYSVYIIRSISRTYNYIGITNDLDRRFSEHQLGYNKTTRAYKPFKLIHTESFDSRIKARKREKYFKSGIGKEWVKGI